MQITDQITQYSQVYYSIEGFLSVLDLRHLTYTQFQTGKCLYNNPYESELYKPTNL
jgi:hypothetical protein